MSKENSVSEETKLGVWGNNTYGQLAVDSKSELQIFMPKMLSFEIDIRDISCGFQHTLFRSVEGEVFVTGDNSKQQLGIGKKIKRRISPTAIQLEDANEKVLLAQAQGYHNIIYTEYGHIYAWGDNTYGQLGTGDLDPRDQPENITDNFNLSSKDSVIQISLGREHSIVLLNNGSLMAWGSNQSYQLGIDAENNEEIKLPTECLIDEIREVVCGYEHTLFLDKNGDLYGCGKNDKKQVSFQSTDKAIQEPTYIQTPERVKKIYASTFSALITEKDDLYVWGPFLGEPLEMMNPFDLDEFYQDGSQKDPQYSEMSAQNRSQMKIRVESVGLGEDFIVIADDYGDCYSWGNNESGQLGQIIEENQTGLVPFESVPKKLVLFNPFDVKSVHTGTDFTILLISEKTNENYEGTSVDYIPYNMQYNNQQQGFENKQEKQYQGDEEEEYEQEEDSRVVENQKMQVDKNSPLFHIFRMIVFLYEDLRYKLIKIIDENLNVDEVLSEEYVELIKRQQDIIDEYLKIFDLKKNIDLEVDLNNVNKFQYENQGDGKFLEKNFGVNKDAMKNIKNSKSTSTFNKEKILQKLKIEREIVEQRLTELKEYL